MKITPKYLETVCKIGQGKECCRYIVVSGDGIVCAKGDPSLGGAKRFLDERVRDNEMIAQGDNCSGDETEIINELRRETK